MRSPLQLIVIASLALVSVAFAQERRGSVAGRVMDSSQGVLQGARVELTPGGNAAVSDAHGDFTINNVTLGKYTLTVSYVGFEPFSTELNVTGDAAQRVDATLQVAKQIEMVTVRGERERGEVEAINIERTADNIIQGCPTR